MQEILRVGAFGGYSPLYVGGGLVAALVVLALVRSVYLRLTRVERWNLKGVVVVVTGASRGVGKGIAIALGKCGATVYCTARTLNSNSTEALAGRMLKGKPLPGSLEETVEAVNAGGGKGIAVKCDHKDDAQVRALFELVEKNEGRLDCLINNVIMITDDAKQTPPFWTQDPAVYDAYMDVGVRSHYVAATLALPLMLKDRSKRTGLLVNISSPGSSRYMFNVAYGVAKSATDRMIRDFAVDLRSGGQDRRNTNVAALCIHPGLVKTERMLVHKEAFRRKFGVNVEGQGETAEYTGRAIAALLCDRSLGSLSGRTYTTHGLARRYNFTDVDGRQPSSMTSWAFYLSTGLGMVWSKVFGRGKSSDGKAE